MPKDVFISYAHTTAQKAARRLRDELAKNDLDVFLDAREIPYGNPFPRDIADGLLDSRLIIVFADEAYFQRPWCVYEYQVITAPYRAAGEAKDAQLEHVAVVLPEAGDLPAVVAHLPPPLAQISWPTVGMLDEIVEMIRNRLKGLTSTLNSRLPGIKDGAVERLRAGGDIPLAWAKAPLIQQGDAGIVKPSCRQCIDLAPETRGEEFIGRGAEIWRVFYHLATCRAFSVPRACAIQGVGGSGKSQLAAEFVARYGERFFPGGVIWISADGDIQTLVFQFRSIIQKILPGRPDPAVHEIDPHRQRDLLAAVLVQYFSSVNSVADVLWVVDGIPEIPGNKSSNVSYWCPVLDYVSVLVTSRRTGLARMDGYVELGSLTPSSAVELLTRPNVDRRWLREDEWEDLADWVGGLPLAISILRAGLADGFTSAEALKLARRKEPSILLDHEMDALRGEVEDERLRGITEAFDFSCRALDQNSELRHAAHLIARLAPYPSAERIMADLVPSALIGRLAKRSWIQAVASTGPGQVERRWIMHRIPASFLRAHTVTAEQEYTDLFNWLERMVLKELPKDDIHTLEYHLMVIRRSLPAYLSELGDNSSPAIQAARKFAVTAIARCIAESTPKREMAGLWFLAAGLANESGAGDDVAVRLEQAYETGNPETVAIIPHTLQALAGNHLAVDLMRRLLQDQRDEVRYQAIVHASSLKSFDLAQPLLEAILQESNADLTICYDDYLDNSCPALRSILSQLLNSLSRGTTRERERAAQLLGRALLRNGRDLKAGGFTSRHVVGSLLSFALNEESAIIRSAAISSASHYFDAEGYNFLITELVRAEGSKRRAGILAMLGEYLSGTRRPPPPVMEIEWLDSGGIRLSGLSGKGKTEPLPPGVYAPLIEAAANDDSFCSAIAVRAILETNEGKIAAGEAAHKFLDEKEYVRVTAMAAALAEQAPEFTNAYWWRGQAQEALGNTAAALDDYATVIRQTPGFADAYLQRGKLLLQAQQFGDAASDLARAGELDPQLFVAHHLGALALYNLQYYREAEAAASRAIALAPEVGEAWFFRGIARYAAGDVMQALQDIKRAVELNPSDERAIQFKDQLESCLGGSG